MDRFRLLLGEIVFHRDDCSVGSGAHGFAEQCDHLLPGHPDLHVASGMPEELIDLANDRLARINTAYEEIMRERVL